MNLDPAVFNKSLETINTAGKIVANLTDPKRPQNPPPQPKPGDKSNTNQPHTQTVEVKVGDQERRDKPMIIHDKQETHVHKTYPDDRAMSKDECEVEKLRIQTAHENAKEEREYNLLLDERNRKERRERDDYERRRREEKDAAQKKSNRRFWICMALFGTACVGAMGYVIYDDYRTNGATRRALSEPKAQPVERKIREPKAIKAEGTVK